ncbi:poly(glycerol-phosphate) alpha-glucosyltransferase [Agromyces sp. 3263]|uniref:glycosyltransferase n=1 Tax=Agromyces sp. 3263 TaxID=2817750 RepID=UPI0028612637|nr:glycosyltransferase [Agromyces sp. 3263]MDR6905907.1 poly(glycerol-phosphate) alpha-glucosyltransferase [Agromyces sp. 3263]
MTASDAIPARPRSFPAGRLLTVTWGVPDQFGGMTSALLHRSRAFARIAGRPVDILTLDGRPDYPSVRERLECSGELLPGMRLRNLYEDLRTGTPPAAAPGGADVTVEVAVEPGAVGVDRTTVAEASDGSALIETRRDGRPVALEHRRPDGTIAVLDERARDSGPRRLITWFDASGSPARQWTSAWACYADWLDGLIGGEPAFAIVDSKTTARFMASYRRPNVTTVHVVHNSHLQGSARPVGVLRPSRRPVFAHLERFDGVAFLTERQRADAAALLSDPGNLFVVPNGIDAPRRPPLADRDRDPAAGVVVAQLTRRKRVDHALDIVARCRARGMPVTLEVFGDGPDAATARARASVAGLGDAVTFSGHRRDAAEAFGASSWTLLTSTSEGAPLVLAEAMSRGCIPVAYDIPYGPADVITDAVDGALVPDGDRDAAAAAIARIALLPSEARERMRDAARASAARFDDERIVADWARVLEHARRRHARPVPLVDATVERLRVRFLRGRLRVSVRLAELPPGAFVVITLAARGPDGGLVRTRRRAHAGRVVWRLDAARTALVGPRHPLTCTVAVELEGSHVELEAATVFPDARSTARRIARRVAQRVRRRDGAPPR